MIGTVIQDASRGAISALAAAWVETEWGRVLVGTTSRGICFVHLVEREAAGDLEAFRQRRAPGVELRDDVLASVDLEQIPEYLNGRRRSFDLPLDLVGTDFQRACWEELLRIPFGSTRTYGEMASRIGYPASAARAVGQANGANPIPLIVPCHRVVARDGLGGYAGGLELKRRLLELEGVLLPTG